MVLGAYTGNGHGLAQPLDETALQTVHLLEVWVEVRHGVKLFVQVRPNGVVGSTIGSVFVAATSGLRQISALQVG